MTSSLRVLVAAAAISTVLGGCASRPKSPPAGFAAAAEDSPRIEPPSGTAPSPELRAGSAQEDLAARAGDRVFFSFDSDVLDGEARATLRGQAGWLAAHPDLRARVAGHADERGTREYNLALGARRAAAARQALIAGGVSPARIETISYGKERPLDPGSGEEAWARNRNAHTVVLGAGGP